MNSSKKLIKFLILAVCCYLVWFLVYELWLKPQGTVDNYVTSQMAIMSSKILNFIGYNSSYSITPNSSTILLDGKHWLGIAHVCNGLVLYALFIGFLVSFPGPIKHKLWFIPLGLLIINLVNVMRAVILSLVKLYYVHTLDFNHRYTFTILVYGCIFLLWVWWVNKFSGIEVNKVNKSENAAL